MACGISDVSTCVYSGDYVAASTQVVLTVQQKPVGAANLAGLQLSNTAATNIIGAQQHQPRPASLSAGTTMVSPSSQPATSLHRASTAPAGSSPCTARITGPQPVDHEKKRQLETQRVHTFQLMLEKEQSYVDKLRSELAKASGSGSGNTTNITTLQSELAGAERRVRTLLDQLAAITTTDQLCSLVTNTSSPPGHYSNCGNSSGGSGGGGSSNSNDLPPPLPSRKSLSMQSLSPPPLPPRPPPPNSNMHNVVQSELERQLLTHLTPPTTSHGIPNSFSQGSNLGSPNSLNKHQRTKSSPEQLGTTIISPSEASRLLIASESMNDLSPPRHGRHSGIDLDDPTVHITPPGTPPPPYPQPSPGNDISSSTLNESLIDSFMPLSPSRQTLNESNSGLPIIQQPIMSMEDDDMSDQEVGQLEDHGPFKSLSRLWEHHAHLSVFINYVLSNSDPSSLLFYLITDLYKEGNAKEMRKWAYEIHSSFLVPGAPLRLHNVDENVAREIDEVLQRESDKEEILRKIFWKARTRAKEELNEQLADFQQKRTAGLGMLFGPSDAQLDESESDKSKESKVIETYLLPKMEPYLEDMEKDPLDLRQFTTAAGLATILSKIFQIRSPPLDRCPTFVAKDKSNIKARLLTGKPRKMTVRGHHFGANQYFTVTYCNHCQLIIGGIGPQGYQCSDCFLSVHRQCVRVVEENCPGPLNRKERGNDRISKLMERIRPERKPPSSHHHHHLQNQLHYIERAKRTEEEAVLTDGENVETGNKHPVEKETTRIALLLRNSSGTSVEHQSWGVSEYDKAHSSSSVQQRVTKKTAKLKNIKYHGATKCSIAGKVWGTLSAVRRNRGNYDEQLNRTADLIDQLDDVKTNITDINTDDNDDNDDDHDDDDDDDDNSEENNDYFNTNNEQLDNQQNNCFNLENNCTDSINDIQDIFVDGKVSRRALHMSSGIQSEKNQGTRRLFLADREYRGGGASGNARSSTERGRISAYGDHPDNMDDPSSREDISEMVQQNISNKPKTSNINRSESYKERIHHKRQLREKRKTSDPNLSKTK
ncbi:hypothetical protein PV326_001210 [Microctonus aethiopoides]|nr:hypothetical protein PV326_001210 [Microctonus aethiopoides]